MFKGDNVKPRGNWFSMKNLTEPQEPGIGLYFWKMVETTTVYRGDACTVIKSYDNVYARFVLPAQAIITGNGERIDVTSPEAFDCALERGFRYPQRSKEGHTQQVQTRIG